MMKLKDILNEGFKSEYKGNDSIIWKKGKTQGDVTNFTPYYKGHDIDTGGHNFKTEKELKDFIKDYILSSQLYNKYRYEEAVIEENVDCNDCKDRLVKVIESLGIEIWEHAQPVLWQEAEYQGKKVQLGKVTRGGTKKFQVHVKDGDNVKKVSFGDTGLSIKTKDPERRKSFNARHKCDQKKDKTKAGYWSCRMWSGPDAVKNMLSK